MPLTFPRNLERLRGEAMNISVISFTLSGIRLSQRLAKVWNGEKLELFTKCTAYADENAAYPVQYVEESISRWAGKQIQERNILLFIGACGIAVRSIAPHLTDKMHDSPVLVMDEKGEYVIPILSGHLGGANEIAMEIARAIGAEPVITTATDINHRFAVDLFAKRNGLFVVNREGIAKVSSKVLTGKDITISIEPGHIREGCGLPEGVHAVPYPPERFVDIVVTSEEKNFDTAILLRPKEHVIGMGCRRGKEADQIEALIQHSMKELHIRTEQLLALASIDCKKDEQGFLSWSRKNHVPFITYTAEQLKDLKGEFKASTFVLAATGVDNVCERAALKGCGNSGKLIYGKHAEDGMTIAIAKREWSVRFDEE